MKLKLAIVVFTLVLIVSSFMYPKSTNSATSCFNDYGNGTLTLHTYGLPFSVTSKVTFEKQDFVCIQSQNSPYAKNNINYLAVLGNIAIACFIGFTLLLLLQKIRLKK